MTETEHTHPWWDDFPPGKPSGRILPYPRTPRPGDGEKPIEPTEPEHGGSD